jgi:hypothetical protein
MILGSLVGDAPDDLDYYLSSVARSQHQRRRRTLGERVVLIGQAGIWRITRIQERSYHEGALLTVTSRAGETREISEYMIVAGTWVASNESRPTIAEFQPGDLVVALGDRGRLLRVVGRCDKQGVYERLDCEVVETGVRVVVLECMCKRVGHHE